MGAFDISPSGAAGNFRTVTPPGWGGGLMGLRIAALTVGVGGARRSLVVGGSKTGRIYAFGAEGSEPVPLADSATKLLFTSAVIEASPIAYPRPDGSDDLIIGGENGLHYNNVQTAAAKGGAEAISLRSAGKVLEEGAVLVTGQTPTVSIADWDGDGSPDIIAGSSEGRIYLAKATPAGFERPVSCTILAAILRATSGRASNDRRADSVRCRCGWGTAIRPPRSSCRAGTGSTSKALKRAGGGTPRRLRTIGTAMVWST